MSDFFTKHTVNPNDTAGGGGCLGSGGSASEDCHGPWFDFFRVSTEFNQSPHAVLCTYHLNALVATADFDDELVEGDALEIRAPEPGPLQPVAVE